LNWHAILLSSFTFCLISFTLFIFVVGLLDISIPPEAAFPTSTDSAAAGAVLDFEGFSGAANTNHTTTAVVAAAAQSGEDSNSLHQEQLNSSSPGRSPHASKAGWTVSGSFKRCLFDNNNNIELTLTFIPTTSH
jgi:hypothetical protein